MSVEIARLHVTPHHAKAQHQKRRKQKFSEEGGGKRKKVFPLYSAMFLAKFER